MNISRVGRRVAGMAAAAGLMLSAAPSEAAASYGGPAELVDPSTGRALRAGGSSTTWAIKLPRPPASNCSGDSARDAHFVYSYLVPTSVSPARLTFNPDTGVGPVDGELAFPLIDNFGRPYISRNAAPDTGQVLPGTGFTFSRLSIDGSAGGELPPGTYNVGLACWNAADRTLDKYWAATVTFEKSASDANGLVWKAAGAPIPSEGSTRSPLAIAAPAAGIALVAGAVLRRRARTGGRERRPGGDAERTLG